MRWIDQLMFLTLYPLRYSSPANPLAPTTQSPRMSRNMTRYANSWMCSWKWRLILKGTILYQSFVLYSSCIRLNTLLDITVPHQPEIRAWPASSASWRCGRTRWRCRRWSRRSRWRRRFSRGQVLQSANEKKDLHLQPKTVWKSTTLKLAGFWNFKTKWL